MSTAILAALRTQTQLHGNTFLIATELAHRMNGSGYGRASYQFLAWKAHCCRRTAITQIARLVQMGLLTKTVLRTREGYTWNLYQYVGARRHTASPPATTHGASPASTLPGSEREKERSLRAEIANKRQMLQRLTEDSQLWRWTQEDMHALEAILHQTFTTA